MSVINLNRTTKGSISFYQTDGLGRDGYITYNNGGFWKNKQIKLKEVYPPKIKPVFHTLFHLPPPFQYHSDGSGRDTYIIEHNGGLIKQFEPLLNQKLPKFLRSNAENNILKRKIFFSISQRRYLNKLKRIQNDVVNRLYNDSFEKIKKIKKHDNNFKMNSMNDIFLKQRKRIINGIMTPKLNNNKLIRNQSDESLLNNNKENIDGKKIFEKFDKIKNINKENSKVSLGLFNNNKKKILLKKIKINANNTLNDDNKNRNDNIFMKYDNNLNLENKSNFSMGNIKLKKIGRNNQGKIYGNNSYLGCKSTINENFGDIKFKFDNNNNNLGKSLDINN